MKVLSLLLLLASPCLSATSPSDVSSVWGLTYNPTQEQLSESIDDIEYQENKYQDEYALAHSNPGMWNLSYEHLALAYEYAVYPIQRAYVLSDMAELDLRATPTAERSHDIDKYLKRAYLCLANGDGFDHGTAGQDNLLWFLNNQWIRAKS